MNVLVLNGGVTVGARLGCLRLAPVVTPPNMGTGSNASQYARNVSLIMALIVSLTLMGCQTVSIADYHITDGIKIGMTSQELIETKGVPFEVRMLETGEVQYSYYFVLKNVHRDIWGGISRIERSPKRLDIVLDQTGVVEKYEIIADQELEPVNELLNKANAAYSQGDYKTCLELYAQLLKMRPYLEMVRKLRASIYVRYENDEAAHEDYEFILKNNPNNWFANHNRGVIYFRQGEYEKSLESFNRAMSDQKDSVSTRAYRARTYAALGKRALAQTDIEYAKENGFVFNEELKKEIESYGINT